jgi:hypothetical protein
MFLVTFLPHIDNDASLMSQWAQVGIAKIRTLACVWMVPACKSASMFTHSSRVSGRSLRYAYHFTHWKLKDILVHHRSQKRRRRTQSEISPVPNTMI